MSNSNDRKKELKEEYKNMMPRMGAFIIECTINEKCLVVTTKDLKGAMNSIKFKLENGMYKNKLLQSDWNQYGEEAFEIRILAELEFDDLNEIAESEILEELEALEDEWLDILEDDDKDFYE